MMQVRINSQQFWLYATVGPETNEFMHVHLFMTTTTALAQQFLREIREKHDVKDAVFLVDHAQHLTAALHQSGLRFQTVRHGNRNAVEHVFREIKQHTSVFSNSFGHVDPETAKTWLQAFAIWGTHLTKHDMGWNATHR